MLRRVDMNCRYRHRTNMISANAMNAAGRAADYLLKMRDVE